MIEFLAAMFWPSDPHPDSYTWATVLLAHAAVGAVLAAVASLLIRRPVLTVSLAYALIWEGGQLALAGAGLADSLLDWVAVALGAIAAAATWGRQRRRLAATLAAAVAVLWAGVSGRRP